MKKEVAYSLCGEGLLRSRHVDLQTASLLGEPAIMMMPILQMRSRTEKADSDYDLSIIQPLDTMNQKARMLLPFISPCTCTGPLPRRACMRSTTRGYGMARSCWQPIHPTS